MNGQKELIGMREATELMRISRSAIYNSILSGKIPAEKIKSHYLLDKSLLVQELHEQALEDHRRRPAYRLIIGLAGPGCNEPHHIAQTSDDPSELWGNPIIEKYFDFYGIDSETYRSQYLKEILVEGKYNISNLYTILYCRLTPSGRLVRLTPENDPQTPRTVN